jgi:hypothetical protein
MNRKRSALLVLLTREMQRRGSWCGETHIQKATFFLQELLKVNAGFEFILYRHGPFSFDLRDELLYLRADDLLELTVRQEGYGPAYTATNFSADFLTKYPKTVERFCAQVKFVAEELKDKGVTDLEKLATAFYIRRREKIKDPEKIVERLIDLKPHVSRHDAWRATDELAGLLERAKPFVLHESDDWFYRQAS